MLGRIRDAYRWVHGVDQHKRGNYERAWIELLKIRGVRKGKSEFNAMIATISLFQGNHENAKHCLKLALYQSDPTKSAYRQYVDHYCGYYLSALEGNEGAKVKHLEAALKVPAPAIIKLWLPLS